MSPFIFFEYLLALSGGVLVVGTAMRLLGILDLMLKAELTRAPKEPKPKRRRFWQKRTTGEYRW